MATLSQSQIDALKNKGLSPEKIEAIATQKGYTIPKGSLLKRVGSALVESERRFGQSIAGAVGSTVLSGTKKSIEEANQRNQQVQTNLINRIQEKRKKGEDTSRLINALKTLDSEVNFYDILNDNTGGSLNKSAKQVFGEGFGVAADIIGAGALPGGVGAVTKATSFGQGIRTGAKAGAIGGSIFGSATSTARSAQNNESAGEIVGSGIRGGVQGAIGGAVVGGALGGVSGGIAGRQEKILNKKLDYTLDLVSPKVTRKVAEKAGLERRVTAQGLIKPAKILPSREDYLLADAVSDIVPVGAKPTEAVDYITGSLSEIDNGLKNMIAERNMPVDIGQLTNRFNAAKDDVRLIFASDKTAEKTYNAVVDEFLKHVKKADLDGLFAARQSFDNVPAIQKLLNSEGIGENVRKTIVTEIRKIPNEFVSSMLPANNPLKPLLLQEHRLMKAMSNIVQKNVATIGKSKLNTLLEKYPWLKYILYGVGTGAAFKVTGINSSND